MDELKLPERLKGPWHHAVILTYGMDIPFFESALLSQFGARCRNKIILADGRQYLEASANYAQSGLVRYMNQRYVAEGIYSPRAAHAKLILLTHPEEGRLLVGSGNLGLPGYATSGELFTEYEYSSENEETLPAFLGAIDLIKGLIAKGYVSETAARHFDRLLENTAWLFQSSATDWQPVRHNLERPFLDQLLDEVKGEQVEELWILSPFYDPSAYALTQLLKQLRPQKTFLLVQPGSTSVDPDTLVKVITESESECSVFPFHHSDDKQLYFHAKLYLLKLNDRAICLQGSPNLSQVALLRNIDNGNVEIANLLTGSRTYFDHLFEPLVIEPETDQISSLDLSLQTNNEGNKAKPAWQLCGGEWQDNKLVLTIKGDMPDLVGAKLNIVGDIFDFTIVNNTRDQVTLEIPPEAISLLKHTVPVMIQWEDDQSFTSNPIFVCNRAGLNAVMEAKDSHEKIDRAGGLDLDDEELEQLVGELESHMIIDRKSVWQVAGKRLPSTKTVDDEALRLDYADIDYEMLRQHPKIRQYTTSGQLGSSRHSKTRLQIILSSITDHFQGLIDAASGERRPVVASILNDIEAADTEEDIEQEAEAHQKRQRSYEQRLRHIFKNFIRRYLRGIASPDFQELVGYDVITHNYIIFSHLLWALYRKEWFESESQFVTESLLKTWQFFWGMPDVKGFYQEQNEETQEIMQKILNQYQSNGLLIAALFQSAKVLKKPHTIRLALRDFWRYYLEGPPIILDDISLEDAWIYITDIYRYSPPIPSEIVSELSLLAQFETENNFLRLIEEISDKSVGSCYFDRVIAHRIVNYRRIDDNVKCLFVPDPNNELTQEMAMTLLKLWIGYEHLDHYRISFITVESTKKILFYETNDAKGVFWDEAHGIEAEIIKPVFVPANWNQGLINFENMAKTLDSKISTPLAISLPQSVN